MSTITNTTSMITRRKKAQRVHVYERGGGRSGADQNDMGDETGEIRKTAWRFIQGAKHRSRYRERGRCVRNSHERENGQHQRSAIEYRSKQAACCREFHAET